MRPLDNLRILLDGGCPAWLPFTLDVGACPGLTAPVERRFREATGSGDPGKFFGSDVRLFSFASRYGGDDPASLHKQVEPGTTFDEWGIGHWAGGQEGTVDKSYPPLAGAESTSEVEALPSPVIEPADPVTVRLHHMAGYPVFAYAGSIYEWAWWLRGMERFLMDLLDQPAMAEAILRKTEEHTTRLALATAAAGVDVLCFYDDAGSQRGMQIAPSLWRRFVKPAWRRVLETVRTQFPQVRFFLHCCGKIEPIVPDVIELGFHILHPVQPECMDFVAAYREYGRQIVLAATISAQRLFPFGSPQEIREQVARLAEVVGPQRRTIFMPSNRIQPETPWENVLAFAEACREHRAFRR
jgi:uroporphyrinogen decarboxylase